MYPPLQSPEDIAEKLGHVLNNCAHLEMQFAAVCETAAKENSETQTASAAPDEADAQWGRIVAANLSTLDSLVEVRRACCRVSAADVVLGASIDAVPFFSPFV